MITTLSWPLIGEKDADAAGLLVVLAEVPGWGTLPGRHWSSLPVQRARLGLLAGPARGHGAARL